MKKILTTILLITYAFASSGASVDLHYCMGELIGFDFHHTAENNCDNCGMQTKASKGCCDNKQLEVKVDKEQKVTYYNLSLFNHPVFIEREYINPDDRFYSSENIPYASIHGPPLIRIIHAYLFNCNFRI